MRWKINRPEDRAKRVVTRFAFWPMKIEGYWVWLECYKQSQWYDSSVNLWISCWDKQLVKRFPEDY